MKKQLIYAIKAKFALFGLCFVLIGLQIVAGDIGTSSGLNQPIWFQANSSIADIQKALAKPGVKVDARNDLGQTGLMFAITMERFGTFGSSGATDNLVEVLIANGADVNARSSKSPREEDFSFNNTPLHYVSILSNNRSLVGMTDYLIDKGADINAQNSLGETPFMWTANIALLEDKRFVVRAFITDFTDVNMQNNIGDTYLHIMINNKDYMWVQELLNTYGSMFDLTLKNDQGWTPLDYAVNTLQPESERAIRGLRLIGTDEQVNERDALGRTGLMLAIMRNDLPFAQRQIQFESAVNTQDGTRFSNAPLHFAVMRHHNGTPFVDLLLESKANPNIRSGYGDTPLHYLVRYNTSSERDAIAQKLIGAGADPHQKNSRGQSAIDMAQKKDPSFAQKLTQWYATQQQASKEVVPVAT